MRGMMGFLEKAGLVSRVEGGEPLPQFDGLTADVGASDLGGAPGEAPVAVDAGLSLEQVYQNAGVPPSPYPAERLLRLLDGLKAMDDILRRQTIQAIDAADDSWTIQDPINDAGHKVRAIGEHVTALRAGVAASQSETEAQLATIRARQDETLNTIKQQISDLEALMAREVARAAQECAALEADLQNRRHDVERDLAQLTKSSGELQGLINQFGLVSGQ
jgi:hypothetical protein